MEEAFINILKGAKFVGIPELYYVFDPIKFLD
jgi:hypothetical protein